MTTATATRVRTVEGAIAFTDLSGFTEFCAIKGDEAAVELISMHEQMLRAEIGRRGRVVKNLGDGFMLFFGDPCDAVQAALALQDTFEDASFSGDFPLWCASASTSGRRSATDVISSATTSTSPRASSTSPRRAKCSSPRLALEGCLALCRMSLSKK